MLVLSPKIFLACAGGAGRGTLDKCLSAKSGFDRGRPAASGRRGTAGMELSLVCLGTEHSDLLNNNSLLKVINYNRFNKD